jgi:hypothetical protein
MRGVICFHLRISKRNVCRVILAEEEQYKAVDRVVRKGKYLGARGSNFAGRTYQFNMGQPVATVLFRVKHLGAGIVAHEFTHAAFHFLTYRRKRSAIGRGSEERLADIVGELNRKFWLKFNALKKAGRLTKRKA